MKCATSGCEALATGKSKYCTPHKREARAAWLSRIQADTEKRSQRNAEFSALWARALAAGSEACANAVPTPMVVAGGGQRWFVSEGACGFAWVTVRPGNSSFARWAVKHAGFFSAYDGGVQYWVSAGGQSIVRKEAAARAIADALREAGVKAYEGSRLD